MVNLIISSPLFCNSYVTALYDYNLSLKTMCTSPVPMEAKKKLGQVFKNMPSQFEGQQNENEQPATLELFVQTNNPQLLRNCDNLTATCLGDLIISEDRKDARLISITPDGQVYHFAQNIGYRSEFTGFCFSPDKNIMIVNIQTPVQTLAINYPWWKRLPTEN